MADSCGGLCGAGGACGSSQVFDESTRSSSRNLRIGDGKKISYGKQAETALEVANGDTRSPFSCALPVETCGFNACCGGQSIESPRVETKRGAIKKTTNFDLPMEPCGSETPERSSGWKNSHFAPEASMALKKRNRPNKLMMDGVHYSNAKIDKVHWLQFIGNVFWPFVQKAVTKYIVTDLTDAIRAGCVDIPMMANFTFTQCDFGSKLPTFDPLTTRNKDDGVELHLDLDWLTEDALIEVDVGGLRAGMRNIRIQCSVLLNFCPLLEVLPITGGMGITFPNPPELEFEWTGVGRAFPAKKVHDVIVDAISDAIVVPNRVFVNIAESSGLVEEKDMPQAVQYESPPPLGILRVEVIEGRDFPPADLNGSSDPYVMLKVGTVEYTTRILKKTLAPKWNSGEGCDFLIYHPQQQVSVAVFDEDKFGQDDLLGFAYVEGCEDNEGEPQRRKPTVAEMVDNPGPSWWPLDIACGGHNADKYEAEVKLKCQFSRVDSLVSEVSPNLLNCPKKCGLTEDNGKMSSTPCGRCNRTVSQTWKERFSFTSSKRPKGKVCGPCKFGVCNDCWLFKRPSCGLLRITLKSARVPPHHSDQTSVVSFEFEGVTAHSKVSKHPVDLLPVWMDKMEAVNNLHWHAKLPVEMIGKSLGMPVDEVEHLLSKTPQDVAPMLPQSFKDAEGRQTILWDEAFHFLVRDPGSKYCAVKVVYKSGGGDGFFSGKGNTCKGTLQMAEVAKRGGSKPKRGATTGDWLQRFEQKDVEWRVTSSEKSDKTEVLLMLDVRMEPLTANLLQDGTNGAARNQASTSTGWSGNASEIGSDASAAAKRRLFQSQVLFSQTASVWSNS